MGKSYHILVTGLVQGVGFRPFIYRIAHETGISGTVENTNEGVDIYASGEEGSLRSFLEIIPMKAPRASHIENIQIEEIPYHEFPDFRILRSSNISSRITEISPDIAVCEECLRDMEVQPNRIHYPFVNCTLCGPRFSIIRDIPYDRDKTTMQSFSMCDSCRSEYTDVQDRRFHAQPVACNDCGPQYSLHTGNQIIKGTDEIVMEVRRRMEDGGIVAMKGIGGFHIACNALDEKAVDRLRSGKQREGKPFAVMFRDIEEVRKYAFTEEKEEQHLLSWRRPIVILRSRLVPGLAPGVSMGLDTIGAMLPYMPFHHLLFREPGLTVIVLTSGNLSDEPIITSNEEAFTRLNRVADAILVYNREIANRTDDSIIRVIGGKGRITRRSRGYVPEPIRLEFNADGILATGPELSGCLAVGKDNMAILSQHIGDLVNPETCDFFEETLHRFTRLFRVSPSLIASDLHPDYFTTRFAEKFSGQIKHIKVQHHHAHIAACMAEHGIDRRVIGIAMDGTGYGTDGRIWGAEFLDCDMEGFDRFSHFEYMPLPGGDKGIEEPWRMGVSYLFHAFGESFLSLDIPFLKSIGEERVRAIIQMIHSGINCPLVSSAGRLCDAVAAILGLCSVSLFHAEAPMRLESALLKGCKEKYPYRFERTFRFDDMIREIVSDIRKGVGTGTISAKFHNTLISVIFDGADAIRRANGLNTVVLSGGTFQNRYLLEGVEKRLEAGGFQVFSPARVPANDGGIALGQLAVAAKRRGD